MRTNKNQLTQMLRRWMGHFLALILVLPFTGTTLHAQFESASVLGYVRDSSGASIPGAKVTLTNVATQIAQTKQTDSEGKFEFPSVDIGKYQIRTEAEGFDQTRTETFAVLTNARQRVDVALKTGSVTQVVEVTSAAQLLETETSSRGQVIGTQQVENLPLNGRSYADLVLLVPGARKSVLENQTTSSREASFNINGQRSAFNNFLLDGLDNNSYGTSNQGFANENIPPSPDAVSEFKVETNNYSAEYGRASGAVINASIRRGTNQFHGRAWDYNRNTVFNAIGPFPANGGVKPSLIRNQFGGTFGGPIWKDHTFFFADYEGLRQIARQFSAVTLPTSDQRAGRFSVPIRNPVTGAVYANGIVPASAMTPFAQAVLAALPTNNTGLVPSDPNAISNNYVSFPRGTTNDDKADLRVDHTFNQRWSVFGRYSEHRGSIFDPPAFGGRAGGNSNGNVKILNRQIAGGVTWVISPTSLLDLRMGFGLNQGGKSPIGVGDSSLLTENGITNGIPTDKSIVRDLNQQSVNGFTQFGAQSSNPQFQNPTVYNPKLNYTFVKGKHSMKLGYEYQAVNTQINDFNPSYGSDTYNGGYSSTGVGGTAARATQDRGLADFMFGNRSAYSLTNFTIVNLRQRFNFMYFQDDIKVSPNLTINAGIRYEVVTPQYEANNKLANFDPRVNALVQARDGNIYDRSLVNVPLNNIGPRFGLAYSATPKTVLRAGYGISFTQYNRAGGENNLTYNGPNVVNASINNPVPTLANLCTSDTQDQTKCFRQTQQGYSTTLTAASAFDPLKVLSRYIPRDFKTGYVQSYHVGFQQQVPGGIVMDVAYVGNVARHLQILADYNQATSCTAATCGNLQARRPISNFAGIEVAYGAGTANYNSLQFKMEKRYGDGLYLLNSFTWGRTFDLSSGHLETANGDNSRVNFANSGGDYGRSGYDQPLANTTSILYDLPYGHGRRFGANSNYLMNAVLGGWQITVINSMTSGLPFNLNYTLSSNSSLYVSDLVTYRPNVIGAVKGVAANRVKVASGLNGYLDKNAVAVPTASPFGNAQRNYGYGYAFFQPDLGLHKAFQLWNDSSTFDFRAEAFNVINKVNYGAPNVNISAANYGSITTAYPARQLQLAAKIIF